LNKKKSSIYKTALPVGYNHQNSLPGITEKSYTLHKMHTMLENTN